MEQSGLLMLGMAGAAISYFLDDFPQSELIKRRIALLFPNLSKLAIVRLHFLFFIAIGTLVVWAVIDPQTKREALLSGFGWVAALLQARRKFSGVGRSKTAGTDTASKDNKAAAKPAPTPAALKNAASKHDTPAGAQSAGKPA